MTAPAFFEEDSIMFSAFALFRPVPRRRRLRPQIIRGTKPRRLHLEMLEDRRLLAVFTQDGMTLNIDLNAASESVGIVSSGASYTLTLNTPNTWAGTDTANVAGSGSGTLSVIAAAFIAITDAAAGNAVTFQPSGGNAYAADFTIVLDDPAAGPVTFAGAANFAANRVSITIDGAVEIQQNVTANGGITLQPATLSRTIGLNDPAAQFNLTAAALGRLVSTGTVTIGAAGGTGAVGIGSAGAIDLSAKSFGLTLRGGDATFSNLLRIPSTTTLRLNTGAVTSASGDGIDVRAGTLWLDTLGQVGAADNPLTTHVANLRGTVGGDLFIRENDGVLNQLTISEALSAGPHTIHLVGGTFLLGGSDRLDDNSQLNVAGATFDLVTRNDTVQAVTLTSGQITGSGILTSATTFQVQSGVISARLAGPVGLNKTTGGTVALNGANTYTGVTTIAEGVLVISNDNRLGATPNHLVIAGGTLRANLSFTLSANRSVGIGPEAGFGTGTIDVVSGAELTYNGVIANRGTGVGQLIKTGLGLLTLGGMNTYSGGTVIEAGVLRIAADSALGAVPATPTPGHLQLRGSLRARESFVLAANRGIALGDPNGSGTGAITVDTDRTLTYHGVIADNGSGADSLIKRGAGTLVLGSENTYRGGTFFDDDSVQFNAGTIQIDHPDALGTEGVIQYLDDATLRYGLGITEDLSSRIVTGPPTVRSRIDTNGNDVEFATPLGSTLPGGGRLEKLGAGKLTLTTLDTNEWYVLFVLGGEFVVPTGTLRLTGTATDDYGPGSFYGPASVFVQRATLTIAGGTVVTAGSLLAGYQIGITGRLDMTSGLLEVGLDLATGGGVNATVNIRGAATQVTVARDFIVGFNGGGPTVNISDAATINVGRDFVAGIDGGSPTVNISGADTQVTVAEHLTAGQDGGSPTVNISGGMVVIETVSLRHLEKGNAVVNLTGGVLVVAEIVHETASDAPDAGNDSLTINLDAGGTLVTDRMYLYRTGPGTQSWTHSLAVRFDGGLLLPKSDGAHLLDEIFLAPGAGGLLVWHGVIEDGGAIIDTSGFNASVLRPLIHDVSLGPVRDGGLRKQGVGTLTLAAAPTFTNTFTGPVIIATGTLALVATASNNNISKANIIDVQFATFLDVTGLEDGAGAGTMLLADGQTLKGTGTVTGKMIADSGSTVAPGGAHVPVGGSPGILIQDGDYTMNAGSSLNIEIGGNTAGNDITNHGQIDVTGSVRLDNATLNVAAFNSYLPQRSDEYVIINNDGLDTVTGTFVGLPEGATLPDFLDSGMDATITYRGGDGNDVVIFFQISTGIQIEKSTNGVDADEAPGPLLAVGAAVTWTYVVTNTGNTPLTNVAVSDSQDVTLTGPVGDTNSDGRLDPGETWTYTAVGTAAAGQYANLGTATATDIFNGQVSANDPSHYFGVTPPGIQLEKSTNGVDADVEPGPLLAVGAAVTWTYVVTNIGNTPLTNVAVSDSQDVTLTGPVGDTNGDDRLDSGETWTYTAVGTAAAGQYANLGTATATDVFNGQVSGSDPSHYFGVTPPGIQLEKSTNGVDADVEPGPLLAVGAAVTWTYVVTNIGNTPLTNVAVSDSQDVTLTGPVGDTNGDDRLDSGETWTYTAVGTAAAGQYANLGTATATDVFNGQVSASDPSHYFGVTSAPILVLGPDKNPGTPQYVKVVDISTSPPGVRQFVAYEDTYAGGTRVAVADLDGDGTDEIITAPGRNRAPEVRVFTLDGNPLPGFPGFLAYDPAFMGGVQVTVADVNGDGKPDIITVPSYGAADVRVFLNQSPLSPAFRTTPDITFRAFPTASLGGAVVVAADMGRMVNGSFINDPDGEAEIVVGTGAGSKATVTVFDVSGAVPTPVQTFFPFTALNSDFLGGVSLDVARIDADAIPDVIVGMGVNGTSRIEVWAWDTPRVTLSLLGAIPDAFTGSSNNAPVQVAARISSSGDGVADAIFAVQGPIGTTGAIHRFDLISTAPFQYQQAPPLTGFHGPWFIATSKAAALVSEPPVDGAPSPAAAWTNLVNPRDVNNDGLVSPLDVLETINYINANPGQTAPPAEQFSPPRFFDINADGAITPGDVLVVLNSLNRSSATSGEGETSEPVAAIAGMIDIFPSDVGLAGPCRTTPVSIRQPDFAPSALDAARVSATDGAQSDPKRDAPQIPCVTPPPLAEHLLLELESILDEILSSP
jgi:autotransporter-associated beta strand protein